MKYLITGASGQLGYDVVKELENRGISSYLAPTSKQMDIRNKEQVCQIIQNYQPDVIIHCAAYTLVDKAEDEREKAMEINKEATENIVFNASKVSAKVIYVSTDYVFNGEKEGTYQEEDKPDPRSVYGKSKYLGEEEARKYEKHFIVRTSWVFGIHGNNFIKTMLRLSENHQTLNVVSDQIGSPTYTVDLARFLIDLAQSDKYGTYHVTNEGFCSWYEFAKAIFKEMKKDVVVNPVSTEEYQQQLGTRQAPRPKNSRLSKQKLKENGFAPLPSWQDALKRYCTLLKEENEKKSFLL